MVYLTFNLTPFSNRRLDWFSLEHSSLVSGHGQGA
jgi:hypothetical protein